VIRFDWIQQEQQHLPSIINNKLCGQMNELLLPVTVWQCV